MRKFWEIVGGRKFIALILSFVGLIAGKVTSQDWVWIVAIFCGANALIDIFRNKSYSEKPNS